MDKPKAEGEIIAQALKLVAFDGWNQAVLGKAALAAGYKKTDAIRVFPGGAVQAAEAFTRRCDSDMLEALTAYHFESMKIRARIATAIRVRLTALTPHREAVRKTVALLSLPFYLHRGLRGLYDTVDAIWYAAGDNSTDFNFYSKRLLLAGVYSSTLLYWLDDQTPGQSATWDFLDRRIEDVMKIEKGKQRVRTWLSTK